jgi:hypothetical protein
MAKNTLYEHDRAMENIEKAGKNSPKWRNPGLYPVVFFGASILIIPFRVIGRTRVSHFCDLARRVGNGESRCKETGCKGPDEE